MLKAECRNQSADLTAVPCYGTDLPCNAGKLPSSPLAKTLEISEWKTPLLLFTPLNSQFPESERQEFCASQRKELGIMQQQQKEKNTTCSLQLPENEES